MQGSVYPPTYIVSNKSHPIGRNILFEPNVFMLQQFCDDDAEINTPRPILV